MLTARQTFEQFLRIPEKGTRRLVPLQFHAEQDKFIDAYDARDAHGAPRYTELFCSWIKKAGKSETAAGLVLTELIGNTEENDREIIIVASDLAQSKDVTFASACRFVRRNAHLSNRIRILSSELVYTEKVTNHRTGGSHTEEHIVRAVPARDAKSLHGNRATLTCYDEYHAIPSYELVEALALAPSRKHPRILYFSYAGRRIDAKEGNPLWDLTQRCQRGDDPQLYVSHIGGPEGWKQIPWITQGFIDQQRRQFASVPSKFQRLWLNEWATGDAGSFLSADEIRAAIDTERTGEAPEAIEHETTIGLDLGLTFDTTAIVATHIEGMTNRLIVDAVRILRGTKAKPVSLMEVEDVVVEMARRLNATKITADQWQAAMLSERLRARGLSVRTVVSDPASLDRWATRLKTWFSNRLIRIPNHRDFIEQLEGLEGEELRRRDRVRFTATGHRHDDAAIALCLAAEPLSREIGRIKMADMHGCAMRDNQIHVDCYLFNYDGATFVPSRMHSLCQQCPGHQSVLRACEDWRQRSGEALDVRTFVQRGLIAQNGSAGWVKVRKVLNDRCI